uniref:Rab11 family-interacting protein 5 n=1 Tax=Cacopsylla melanoneura TaxID=428564 RepID=A0A8D8YAD4_9HEMI
MWSPTHVQVTVQKAKGLLTKGKNGTNEAFVTIALGKEKYQTSVKEKAPQNVEWHEECELEIPKQGNKAEIILTALHHNFLGVDEFLGQVSIPLNEMDIYERPRNRWYKLKNKPGKEENKERGEIEAKITFTVRSGSLSNLSKKEKHKSSLGAISQAASSIGGSLMSINSEKRGLKKFAKSIGNKMIRKDKKLGSNGTLGSSKNLSSSTLCINLPSKQIVGDADPGVISDEDEFAFDNLSSKSSVRSFDINHSDTPPHSSLDNVTTTSENSNTTSQHSEYTAPPAKPPRTVPPAPAPLLREKSEDEWEQKLHTRKGLEPDLGGRDTLKRRLWENSHPWKDEDIIRSSSPSPIPKPRNNSNVSESDKSSGSPMSDRREVKPRNTLSSMHEQEKKESKLKNNTNTNTNQDNEKEKKSKGRWKDTMERIIIGRETEKEPISVNQTSKLSPELLSKYEGKTRDDLIEMVLELKDEVEQQAVREKEIKDYLEDLLLRVMETSPWVLQKPFMSCKSQSQIM